MTAHRIRHLHLRIRAAEGDEAKLRVAAEKFARAVLERSAELLEAQAPGRVLLIRRLPLRWRLGEAALGDQVAVARFARELVVAVESAAKRSSSPAAEDDLAVFDNETHWLAAYLAARARGSATAWFFAGLATSGDPVQMLAVPERRELALDVLDRLAADGGLVEVLAAMSSAESAALSRSIGIAFSGDATADAPIARRAASGQTHVADDPEDWPSTLEQLAKFARALPTTLAPAARDMAMYVHARKLLAPGCSDREIQTAAARVLVVLNEELRSAVVDSQSAISAPEAIGHGPTPLAPTPSAAIPAQSQPAAELRTRFGGLFYLLNVALELDIGELLWKACIPECEFLSHAATALLGPSAADDPAPALFGGASLDRPLPEITPEQHEEVCVGLMASLAAALPRRGLADLPELALGLVRHPAGRLLVATPRSSPLALFAWPAATARQVESGTRTLLRVWPTAAPRVLAVPAIAELSTDPRLRAARGGIFSSEPMLPAAPSLPTGALLAQVIAAICHVFAARVGEPPTISAAAFVEIHLSLPGAVTLAADTMVISLPLECINLSVRRAGFDRDPGWTPWLSRTVRFNYFGPGGDTES